jgi:ATP-binding cassette subfamily F protein uup
MQYALLGDGALRHLPRGVDQYLELRKAGGVQAENPAVKATSGAEARASQKNLQKLERAISKAEAQELEVRANLEKHDPADYEGLAALAARAQELATKRDELEASWLAESENGA